VGDVKLNCKSGKIKIISFNEQQQQLQYVFSSEGYTTFQIYHCKTNINYILKIQKSVCLH